jgi:hypothetical protein
VDTKVKRSDVLDGAQTEVPRIRDDGGHTTTVIGEQRRIAYCECGAQLVGGSKEELFDAAQQHIAHHHPQLLGALELDVLMQMAEDVGGIDA